MSTSRIDNDMNKRSTRTSIKTGISTSSTIAAAAAETKRDPHKELKDFYHDMYALCQVGDVYKRVNDQTSALQCYEEAILKLTQFMQKGIPDWQKTYVALMLAYASYLKVKLSIISLMHNHDSNQPSIEEVQQQFNMASAIVETYITPETIQDIAFELHFEQIFNKLNTCLDRITNKLHILVHGENVVLGSINPDLLDQKIQAQFKLFSETPSTTHKKNDDLDTDLSSDAIFQIKYNSSLAYK